ncbi:MAG: DUF1501 domain-containing protein [Bacteroidales bacterium]|nr:DUF1501 domain-containing protein [Bacteroidales bacterium]
MNRRDFLAASAACATVPSVLSAATGGIHLPRGKAEHCIFIWLGGGMGQADTFDPKVLGKNKGTDKKAGSLYPSIATAVRDVRVCEHLKKTANLMDRVTAIRTVNHRVIDEHAFATNLVHTARMISGTTTYPSIGSIVAHKRGAVDPTVPAYILIGYPNVSRGPGFLGAQAGFVYLTDTESGPAGFTRPSFVTEQRAEARKKLLNTLKAHGAAGSTVADYTEAQAEALRLAGPKFMKTFDLTQEPAELRNQYGGEFGQRCLLSRRLVQAGVRFIEVSHNLNFVNGTGWDVHNEGIDNQHVLIQELDTALATLIQDLEAKNLLDRTLIVVGTEFGRPPEFDGRGGRGHQGSAFSLVLAGGGLRHHGAYGVTDELSKKIVSDPVSLPDFHATIHWALGIDPTQDLMDNGRPVPLTDGGQPVKALFG